MVQRRWYTEKTDSKRIYQRICGSMKLYNIDRLKDKYILYFESEDTTYHIIKYVDEDGNPVDENGNAIVEEPVEKKKSTRGRKSTTGTKKETTKKTSTRKKKSVEE